MPRLEKQRPPNISTEEWAYREEMKRRLIGLRELRGVKQRELGALLEADGLPKHDVGKIERLQKTMRAAHRRALAHHLRVDERWFTDPLDDLLGAPALSEDRGLGEPPGLSPPAEAGPPTARDRDRG